MKFLFAFLLIPLLITPAFAQANTQTLPTEKGTLEVKLSYDEVITGQLTTLRTDFINPFTQEIQVHIDWRFSVSKDGEIIWGPTNLLHTSEGTLKNLKFEFQEDGLYTVEFGVEGILFQPIPPETVSFDIVVGESGGSESTPKIPEWVKNTMKWFVEGKISEDEMINALQFLIREGIIRV